MVGISCNILSLLQVFIFERGSDKRCSGFLVILGLKEMANIER
jgi:hypothetical protein